MAVSPDSLTRPRRLWRKERCSTIRMPDVTTMTIITGKDTSADIITATMAAAAITASKNVQHRLQGNSK